MENMLNILSFKLLIPSEMCIFYSSFKAKNEKWMYFIFETF